MTSKITSTASPKIYTTIKTTATPSNSIITDLKTTPTYFTRVNPNLKILITKKNFVTEKNSILSSTKIIPQFDVNLKNQEKGIRQRRESNSQLGARQTKSIEKNENHPKQNFQNDYKNPSKGGLQTIMNNQMKDSMPTARMNKKNKKFN